MKDSTEPRAKISLATVAFRLIVVLGFLGLTVQLWQLQIVQGRQLNERGADQRTAFEVIPPPRGVIYDRTGPRKEAILASNSAIFVVNIVPGYLPKGNERQIYDRLSGMINVPSRQMDEKVQARREQGQIFTPLPIKYNVDRITALKIEESHQDLPGVVVSVGSSRHYQTGDLLSHLLGYTSLISPTLLAPEEYNRLVSNEGYTPNDRIGAAGLEEQYESALRGRPGKRAIQVDATGRPIREIGVIPAQPGNNLVLTIDLDLQRFVMQSLREGLTQSPSGVVVVSNPKTGEILALASLPTYDDNVFSDDSRDDELAALLKDTSQPFFHRAAVGLYPPGSTFKLISAMGALQEGLITRDTVIESKGVLWVPYDLNPSVRQRFPEWNPAGLGKLNLISAIANSSNIFFFYLGGGYEPEGFQGLGAERIAKYARMFGYGAATGIDLPNEANGTIPDDSWKLAKLNERWFKGDTYNMAIGQGYVQATPLQVANATNAIANGGTLLRPHLVRQIMDGDGKVISETKPRVIRTTDISSQNLRLVVEGMEAGFTPGKLLENFRIPGLRVAGKTGTGEFAGDINARGELPTHGWFTGFAPVEDPQIAVTVFVERGSGSKDAAPIAAKVLRYYFKIPQDARAEPAPPLPPVGGPAATSVTTSATAAPTARPAQAPPPRAVAPATTVEPTAAATPAPEAQPSDDQAGARPTRTRQPAARTPGATSTVPGNDQKPTPQPAAPQPTAPAAVPTSQPALSPPQPSNKPPAPAPTSAPQTAPPPANRTPAPATTPQTR